MDHRKFFSQTYKSATSTIVESSDNTNTSGTSDGIRSVNTMSNSQQERQSNGLMRTSVEYSRQRLVDIEPTRSLQSGLQRSLGDSTVASETYSRPYFTSIPSAKTIQTGKLVRFDCHVEGKPKPDIVWLHNGQRIVHDGITKLLKQEAGTHSLTIVQASQNDAGMYTCRAHNALGETKFNVQLCVSNDANQANSNFSNKKYVNIEESDHATKNGSQKMIDSTTSYNNETKRKKRIVKVKSRSLSREGHGRGADPFAKNGRSSSLSRVEKRTYKYEESNMKNECYQQVVRFSGQKQRFDSSSDVPEFETIKLRHIERQSPRPQLPIDSDDEAHRKTIRPTFTMPLRDTVIEEGQRLLLESRLIPIGDPNLCIRWYRNGKLLQDTGSYMAINYNFGYLSLTVFRLSVNDSGQYTIVASNDSGQDSTSCNIIVRSKSLQASDQTLKNPIVYHSEKLQHTEDTCLYEKSDSIEEIFAHPPRFTKELEDLESILEYGCIRLEAKVTPAADPTMKIEWYFNGKTLNASSRIRTMHSLDSVTLNIFNARTMDTGVYMCKAFNAHGEATSSATVRVKGKMHA